MSEERHVKILEIVPYGFPCSLGDCPVGLFFGGDNFNCLCIKTEYLSNGKDECYIEESGETYCGQRNKVQPCIVEESSK